MSVAFSKVNLLCDKTLRALIYLGVTELTEDR